MSERDDVAIRQALASGETRYEMMETITGRRVVVIVSADGVDALSQRDQLAAIQLAEMCCMRMSLTLEEQQHRQRMLAEIHDSITSEEAS